MNVSTQTDIAIGDEQYEDIVDELVFRYYIQDSNLYVNILSKSPFTEPMFETSVSRPQKHIFRQIKDSIYVIKSKFPNIQEITVEKSDEPPPLYSEITTPDIFTLYLQQLTTTINTK